jgi:hypothetical protein
VVLLYRPFPVFSSTTAIPNSGCVFFSDWRMDFPNPKKCIRGEVVAVRCEATGGVCHSPIHSRGSEFGSVRHLCGIQREKFCETLQNPTQRWFSAGGVDAGI